MWSLGCVFYEMITLNPPFRAPNMDGLFKAVSNGNYYPIDETFSADLRELIGMLLQVNPNKRPSCKQLLQLPSVSRRCTSEKTEATIDCDDSALNSDLLNVDLLKTIHLP